MLVLLVTVILFFLYLYCKRNHNYWEKRGIKYEKPMLFFGGSLKKYIEKSSTSGRIANLYRRYPNEKFVGFFEGNQQGLLLRDPGLIKQVLLTDFRNFHYRGANFHREVTEPLMKNLFNVDGDIWKLTRQKLTPMFSSGKLKAMFPLIVERAENLLKIASGVAETGNEVDVRELLARYTTDFIGVCGFGIDANTLNDETSNFRKLGKRIFAVSIRDIIVIILKMFGPGSLKLLHFVPYEVENNTIQLVKQIMAARNYKPIGRNDFIDMMLDLRQKGKIVGESIEKRNADGSFAIVEVDVDDSLLAAQVFVFFAAGFEASSGASSFLLHLLAYHPEEQAQCQQEIDEVLKRNEGKLSFHAVKDMKYLEMAFKEALRIMPSPGFLMRRSVSKYNFPGLSIDDDTIIIISIEALHSDEQYFEDPDKFKPDRFSPGNIENIKKGVYLPFGYGPRACIGERLGVMQSLAGVAAILSKFSVCPSKNSIRKPMIDYKSGLVQLIIGGLPLSLKKRQKKVSLPRKRINYILLAEVLLIKLLFI